MTAIGEKFSNFGRFDRWLPAAPVLPVLLTIAGLLLSLCSLADAYDESRKPSPPAGSRTPEWLTPYEAPPAEASAGDGSSTSGLPSGDAPPTYEPAQDGAASPASQKDTAGRSSATAATKPKRYSEEELKTIYQLVVEAQRLYASKKIPEATKLLEQAANYDPSPYSPNVHHTRGVLFEAQGLRIRALAEYEKAAKSAPKDLRLMMLVGDRYWRLGERPKAIAWFESFINAHPNHPLAAKLRAKVEMVKKASLDYMPSDLHTADYLTTGSRKRLAVWAESRFPLKVFIEDGWYVRGYHEQYRTYLIEAFNDWSAASKGKVSWTLTDQRESAQVICSWVSAQEQFRSDDGGSKAGLTICSIFGDDFAVIEKAEIQIWTMYLGDRDIKHTCLHEVGHALGLNHSPNPLDVLYFAVRPNPPSKLSARDTATLVRLYQVHPASRPVAGFTKKRVSAPGPGTPKRP